MARRESARGPAAFEQYYGTLYADRWGRLREALLTSEPGAAFADRLEKPYRLDPASVLAAAALDVCPGHRVLDLCAAPGGKSLVLASMLGETGLEGGELVCNERSATRRARLHRVLDEHLPPSIRRLARVTGHDAARWALHEPAAYDRVLADVPCSSEQHVLRSAGALAEWSPSRTRRLAAGAYAIGCAAVDAVRPGGRVVYATCALSPLENDGVVTRLIGRGRGTLQAADTPRFIACAVERHRDLLPHEYASGSIPGEPTQYGVMILPDRDHGMGPMYVAVLERIGNSASASCLSGDGG